MNGSILAAGASTIKLPPSGLVQDVQPSACGMLGTDSFSPCGTACTPTSVCHGVHVIQTVEWVGAGPHYWAGAVLPAMEKEHLTNIILGSNVLTVSFFGMGNEKLNITNLSQPVSVKLATSSDSVHAAVPNSGQIVKCAYWSDIAGAWISDNGTDGTVVSETEIACHNITHPSTAQHCGAVRSQPCTKEPSIPVNAQQQHGKF